MIDMRVTGNLQALEALLNPESLRKARITTLRTVQRSTATRVHRATTEKWNVTQRAVADRLRMWLTPDNGQAWLRWSGTRIGMINFSAQFKRVQTTRGTRYGATVRLRKDEPRFLAAGGFIAKGRSGNVHLFQRKDLRDNRRLPIKGKYGPSVPQMIDNPEVFAAAERHVAEEYPKVYTRVLGYYFEKGL